MFERDSPVPAHGGTVESSLDGASPGERSDFQHAGIPESIQLQEGPTHGAGERLSSLVERL